MDPIRSAAAAGRASVGAWVSLADAVSVEMMGRAGFDFAILDTQHGGITWNDLLPAVQGLGLGGTPALVRVGWTDPMQIMRALDVGALGVVVPMVSTPAQARTAAEACRYPPDGIRSFGRVRSYYDASGTDVQPLCFVMIETAEALENLDAIAATPGVDGLFVGPVDLALSLGLGAALQMPEQVFAAIGDVIAACARHDRISGCAGLGLVNAKRMVDVGLQFVTLGSDAGYVRRGAAADIEEARRWATGTA